MGRQPSSRHCFVCGVQNPYGLKLQFVDDGESTVRAQVIVPDHYNGYPGVVHGGIIAALLDETAGRSLLLDGNEDQLMVTLKLEIKYRRPTPTGVPLTLIGQVVKRSGSRAQVDAKLFLPDGTLAAEGQALLMRPSEEFFRRWEPEKRHWRVYDD